MQEEQRELRFALKKYLGQFYRAKMKQEQLKMRLQNFRLEMTGTKAIQYSAVPHASGGSTTSETEIQVIRVMEIEERIVKQQEEVKRAMLAVLEVMDFLPLDSTERMILEYRYIDCLGWKQICCRVSMSRTSCHSRHNSGIDTLLNSPEILHRIMNGVGD